MVALLMCSEGVIGNDTGTAGPAADAVEAVTQPASAAAANSKSVPPSSYQYDTSGMTELSLLTDEVVHS